MFSLVILLCIPTEVHTVGISFHCIAGVTKCLVVVDGVLAAKVLGNDVVYLKSLLQLHPPTVVMEKDNFKYVVLAPNYDELLTMMGDIQQDSRLKGKKKPAGRKSPLDGGGIKISRNLGM